jgi:hypothetical protein
MINKMFETNNLISNITEMSINPVNKPNKPKTADNLRPINTTNFLRKVLETATLERIRSQVMLYLNDYNYAFLPKRGPQDILFMYKLKIASAQKCKKAINVLGIDMSKAFDNAVRELIINVFRPILDKDGMRLLHIVLSNTSLRVKFGDVFTEAFTGNTGTPQGGGLSPIIFTVYIQAIILELISEITDPYTRMLLMWFIFADHQPDW